MRHWYSGSAKFPRSMVEMAIYRLPVAIRPPSEDRENKYLAEVPVLPGCRAWGDTLPEALDYIESVARAFIESFEERGDPLPTEVGALAQHPDSAPIESVVLVAV